MMTALQTLVDNGCSNTLIQEVLNGLLEVDSFEVDDDKRCCIAMLFDMKQGNFNDPADYAIIHDNVVDVPGAEYRVLTDNEAEDACKEYIKNSLWAFNPGFLASETGIDECVFKALVDKCDENNEPFAALINASCGIDSFVEAAIDDEGRGPFLNHYDGEGYEVSVGSDTYYVYRVN